MPVFSCFSACGSSVGEAFSASSVSLPIRPLPLNARPKRATCSGLRAELRLAVSSWQAAASPHATISMRKPCPSSSVVAGRTHSSRMAMRRAVQRAADASFRSSGRHAPNGSCDATSRRTGHCESMSCSRSERLSRVFLPARRRRRSAHCEEGHSRVNLADPGLEIRLRP
jgi:hypothetical protein